MALDRMPLSLEVLRSRGPLLALAFEIPLSREPSRDEDLVMARERGLEHEVESRYASACRMRERDLEEQGSALPRCS